MLKKSEEEKKFYVYLFWTIFRAKRGERCRKNIKLSSPSHEKLYALRLNSQKKKNEKMHKLLLKFFRELIPKY